MSKFKKKRIESGFTQEKIAILLGVTQANISQWESGTASPRLKKLQEAAKIFNCSIDDLIN